MHRQYIKTCHSKRAQNAELKVYHSTFPDKAKLIAVQPGNVLVLSRVDGIPYLDAIAFDLALINCLAQAVSRLHNLFCEADKVWCHWDNQPRNILWSEQEQRIYLIDFEDCRLAAPEADIAHLFLFWSETMPHSEFISHTTAFLQAYRGEVVLQPERWAKEAIKATKRFDARRRKYNKQEPFANPDKRANRKLLLQLIR